MTLVGELSGGSGGGADGDAGVDVVLSFDSFVIVSFLGAELARFNRLRNTPGFDAVAVVFLRIAAGSSIEPDGGCSMVGVSSGTFTKPSISSMHGDDAVTFAVCN